MTSPLLPIRLASWLLAFAPISAVAGDFDGASPLLCALNEVMECTPGKQCQRILPEDAGAPDFFLIDLAKKSVNGVGRVSRTSAVRTVSEIDGKLILHGAEDGVDGVRDGVGWSATIARDTGRFVLSASGDRIAFVVFGACVALTDR